jgi:hypothetical protein
MNQKINIKNNKRNTRSGNNFKRKKPMSTAQVLNKYDTLLQEHLLARKKYHELFHRADANQKLKLEKKYTQALSALREFEAKLRPWQLEALKEKTDGLKLDLTFSSNHDIDPDQSEDTSNIEIEDPHLLESQKNRPSFKDDNEESMGSIEDYYQYKGISAPEELKDAESLVQKKLKH